MVLRSVPKGDVPASRWAAASVPGRRRAPRGTSASGGHASPWAGFAARWVRPAMRREMYNLGWLNSCATVTPHIHTQISVYLERDLWRRRGRGDRDRVRWRGRSRRVSFSRSRSLSLGFGLSSTFAGFSGETSLGTSDTESGFASFTKSLDRKKKKCCEASDHINYSSGYSHKRCHSASTVTW